MIRKATGFDLRNIKRLTELCAREMQQNGIFQWNVNYPSLEVLKRDIEKEELFLLEKNSELAGIIVLTCEMDAEYGSVEWLTSGVKNLYVHRLATDPSHWGKGFGGILMDFAEESAATDKYHSIRLDTFSRNKKNMRFYEKRGYVRLGEIFFPRQSEHPFYCYEKIIKK